MNAKIISLLLAATLTALGASAHEPQPADSLTLQLREVVVSANQPATRLVGSTLVSTIAGSNLSDLGSALDVLAQLPMLKVTDGSVSVIGKNNLEIYIDGRPVHDDFELQQLLSSNLKTVELLMAPGAAYESTTGAVLRITTRRRFVQGLSLTDQLMAKRNHKWSAMNNLNLSYHRSGFEFFLQGTINHNNYLHRGTTTNALIFSGSETAIGSSQRALNPSTASVIKAGLNYGAETWSAGAYYRFNPERGNFTNSGSEWLNNDPPIDRNISKRINAHSHLASLYFEKTFAPAVRLHFDGDFRLSAGRTLMLTAYPATPDRNVSSSDHSTSSLLAGKLNLTLPLLGGELTCGTQASHTRTALDFVMQNPQLLDFIPSSQTEAIQTSAALFASWARTLGKLSLSIGARYEFVDYLFNINRQRDPDISRRNNLLTPDLSLTYSFTPDAQLSLSYKTATVRPPYSQLTGSLTYTGLHELEGGNLALRNERLHNLQLFGLWRDFMLQADLTRSIDTYAFVKQLHPSSSNLRLIMRPVNINVTALSAYLIWTKPIRRWTPNLTLGIYRQWLTLDSTTHNRPIISCYFDNTFTLPHGWQITANISARTAGDLHTNRFSATPFTLDASLTKNLLNKTLTLRLAATDIFNTARSDWTMTTAGIHVDKHQNFDTRSLSLNLTYTFQPRRTAYKGTHAAESELNRL